MQESYSFKHHYYGITEIWPQEERGHYRYDKGQLEYIPLDFEVGKENELGVGNVMDKPTAMCQREVPETNVSADIKTVQYNYLFGTTVEQIKIVKLFQLLMTIQERLLEENQEPACHGNNSGP